MVDISHAAPQPSSALRLYRQLVGARIRSQWQYRTSFVIDTVGNFVIAFVDFVVVLALFRHFPTLEGWSLGEVAYLYGTAGLGFALADLVIGHIENIGTMIRAGTFDTVLIRPVGTLLQVTALDFSLRRVGKVLQAAVVLGVAISVVGIDWTPGRVAMTVVSVVSGAAIFCALFVLWSSMQFWIIGSGEVANAFTYGGNYITGYPLDVLGPWLRRLLTWVIPLGFVAWFPAMYVLGRDDAPLAMQLAGPLVAVVICAVAFAVWGFAVRHYRSTGS